MYILSSLSPEQQFILSLYAHVRTSVWLPVPIFPLVILLCPFK